MTLGPSSFVKDANVSGPREFAIAIYILAGEGACERGTNFAGTNNGVLHKLISRISAGAARC